MIVIRITSKYCLGIIIRARLVASISIILKHWVCATVGGTTAVATFPRTILASGSADAGGTAPETLGGSQIP